MKTKILMKPFGELDDGINVMLYILSSDKIEVGLINYGATILYLKVPDKHSSVDDIVTGFDFLSEYIANRTYFGATVGRVANRIGNGKFFLDGKEYSLPVNNGPNTLHGGISGFDMKLWDGIIEGNSVVFRHTSPDGDEGFPGELVVSIAYTLLDNELEIKYSATTNKATPVNISNHAFFNLGGHNDWNKDLSNHELTIFADEYLPVDENVLVTGEVCSVKNTVFDLRQPVILTEELLNKVPGCPGFDHNFCLQRSKVRHPVAILKHKVNGRVMIVDSTEAGVQLYTGNFLTGMTGKNGVQYSKHSALCLESQNWPDAINHPDTFPNSVLRPGSEYLHKIWLRFETL